MEDTIYLDKVMTEIREGVRMRELRVLIKAGDRGRLKPPGRTKAVRLAEVARKRAQCSSGLDEQDLPPAA